MPRKPTAKFVIAEKQQCHIHDKVDSLEADDIREKVCVAHYGLIKHSDNNHYCLFHLPAKEKDPEEFERILQEKLKAVEEKFESLTTEEIEEDNHGITLDFRYVWFPSKAIFYSYHFKVFTDFSKATFSDVASFREATFSAVAVFSKAAFLNEASFRRVKFSAYADFRLATFSDYVDFTWAVFSAEANFINAAFLDYAMFKLTEFSANANFDSVIFSGDANFRSATFNKDAFFRESVHSNTTIFSDVTFSSDAYFRASKFGETSQIFFQRTNFSQLIELSYALIENYIVFEGTQENRLFIENNSKIVLENLRISDAKKISFQTIRMEPNWFVNTDASGFIFTDCKLEYADKKNLNVEIELEKLKDRRFENPYKILTKACWQLADNHEEMKSFPKASLFRQMANESKRLEDNNGWKFWSLHWWYWLSSFYGERPLRAGLVLVGILLLFVIAFMFSDFQVCPIVKTIPETTCQARTLNVWESTLQSLATATFQSIEYIKPYSKATMFLVILEKILAPLQGALFALAIRRKFMR